MLITWTPIFFAPAITWFKFSTMLKRVSFLFLWICEEKREEEVATGRNDTWRQQTLLISIEPGEMTLINLLRALI